MFALTVDFHGPIAFRFSDKDGATAYIPICDYHTCNVLTDSNDIPTERHRVFVLKEPTGATRTEIHKDHKHCKSIGADLLQESWSVVQRPRPLPDKPTEDECYCIFTLPLPDYVVGLRKEPVTIERAPGNRVNNDYARGHRFCYLECKEPPKISSGSPSRLDKLDARCFQPVDGSDVKYRIEIRYHDINPLQPRPHRDADLCSASMRSLLPPLDKWKVTFEDPVDVVAQVGPQGSDCLAHGLVLDDGGIQ